MSQLPSFKNLRVAAQPDSRRAKLINRLASLPIHPRTERNFRFAVNPNNKIAMRILSRITEVPGLAVSEYLEEAMTHFGYDFNDQRLQSYFRMEINNLLAHSAEGFCLVKNFLVAITPVGGKPRWYLDLSEADRAKVPVRTCVEQDEGVGYSANKNLPAVIGPNYDGVRTGYVSVSGLGKRWISPGKVRVIKNTDVALNTIAVDDAKHRSDLEAALLEAVEAKTELASLIASNKAAAAASNIANASVQALMNSGTPIVRPGDDSKYDTLLKMMTAMQETIVRQNAAAEPAPKAKRRAAPKARKAKVQAETVTPDTAH